MRVGAASQREMVRASMSAVSLVADISRDQFSEAAGAYQTSVCMRGIYADTPSGTTNVDGDRSDCGLGKSGNCCPVSRFLPSIRENLTQNPVPVLESCESSFS